MSWQWHPLGEDMVDAASTLVEGMRSPLPEFGHDFIT
jgi:hypothetical protein